MDKPYVLQIKKTGTDKWHTMSGTYPSKGDAEGAMNEAQLEGWFARVRPAKVVANG